MGIRLPSGKIILSFMISFRKVFFRFGIYNYAIKEKEGTKK